MGDKILKDKILLHVEKSIQNKQYNKELSFDISDESIRRIKAILHFDMNGYRCILKSHDIRHVHKRHPQDVVFISQIPNILETFNFVKKSIIRDKKTGSHLVNLEFYKNISGKKVKLVKLKIHIKKRLELKTLFVEDVR